MHESEVTQSCLTLSDPMDCSPPGSSIRGILQTRVLEWGAIAFSCKDPKSFKTVSPSGLQSRGYLSCLEPSRSRQDLSSRGQGPVGRAPDSTQGPAGTSLWQWVVAPWEGALGRVELQMGKLQGHSQQKSIRRQGQNPSFLSPCWASTERKPGGRIGQQLWAYGPKNWERRIHHEHHPHQTSCSPVPGVAPSPNRPSV